MATTPSTWESLSQIFTALGGVGSAVAPFIGTAQARKVAGANAALAQRNAQVQATALEVEAIQDDRNALAALADARLATEAAAFAARQTRKARQRERSQNLAAMGASGVAIEGSPLETLVENAREAELEGLLIEQRGAYAAQARQREADLQRYQATVRRYQAREVLKAGGFAAKVGQYQAPDYSSALLKSLGSAGGTAGRLLRPTKQLTATDYTDLY